MGMVNKQARFVQCMAILLIFANNMGYSITFGDAYRSPKVTYGHPRSCHRSRLAIDLNLFDSKGRYMTSVNDYEFLGVFWENLDKQARWGGRFNDANHFSFEHNGVS